MKPFNQPIQFTSEEIALHDKHLRSIIAAAMGYLEFTWKNHVDFHQREGVSRYYGDRNNGLDTLEERKSALVAAGAKPSLGQQLIPISCIGLAMAAIRAGFMAPNLPALKATFLKIETYTRANDLDGSAMIDGLQKLGWRILYWNPDPTKNDQWDMEDGTRPGQGWHAERYRSVIKNKIYYQNTVDDAHLLVGFGQKVPPSFLEIPFYIGVAHTGYHIFPGFLGKVIEAHSMRALTSIDNIENSPFNPLASGGGPRWATAKYRSGLICVPPALTKTLTPV